jgi:hypothetical protein
MTQITQAAVKGALDGWLASFGGAGGDINTEGTGYTPQAGSPYVSARISSYSRMPLGVGPNSPNAVTGAYQINVNRPASGGAGMGLAIAARLVLAFARGTSLTLATGQVLVIESAGEQPMISAGDWLTLPVTIGWYVTE